MLFADYACTLTLQKPDQDVWPSLPFKRLSQCKISFNSYENPDQSKGEKFYPWALPGTFSKFNFSFAW